MKHTFRWLSALVVVVVSTLVLHGGTTAAQFQPPVKVTPNLGYGYEPAVVVDPTGNIYVTAHKENWQLVLAPDANSPTYTRSMSWVWMSANDGATFGDIPGLTSLSLEQHQVGDEGDLAVDDAYHLYFVDTYAGDNTFTRWTIAGRGQVTLDFSRPAIPTAQPIDDRPWVIAHGDGHVFYLGNEGDKKTYPAGQGTGSGFGPGRYTVYASYDGGLTFDPLGYTLKDSGWCRGAADHTVGSPYVYVVCGNDGGSDDVFTDVNPKGTLWAYASADDGHTFERFKVGSYKAFDATFSWPTVSVGPDGTVWALYVDATALDSNNNPTGNKLMLFRSRDHGRTWSSQNITSLRGRYEYGWLAVSSDGSRLGLGVYYKPTAADAWRVYGAIWTPGAVPALVSLDPQNPVTPAGASEAPGDLMGSFFGPDGKLSVVWTRRLQSIPGVATLTRDIYYARSQ